MTDLVKLMEERALMVREGRATRTGPAKQGYAARPGTGPAGETCGSCAHVCGNQMARTYWKCDLMRQHWTGGGKTDVRRKSPACKLWK